MSLRVRIPILFIGFAVLPLLLGVGDYLQSVQALRAVIDARRESLAGQTARDVERGYLEARGSLLELGERLASEPGRGELTAPAPFDTARLIGASGTRVLTPTRARERTAGCFAPEHITLRVEGPPGSDVRAVEGTLDLGVFATSTTLGARLGHDGFTRILDRSTGEILYQSSCLGADAGEAGPVAAGAPVPAPDDAWRSSAVELSDPGWSVVVYSNDEEFVAAFRRSRLLYVGVVLLIIIATAGIFSVLSQGSLRSLRSLTRAAEEVQLGNLRPWLPPPGVDEVGRLALAFRKMTDRLNESIRQSELNQKLAAVGELASYLSHEIRNPLSSIRLGLQTLHRDLSAGFIPPDASRIIEISLNEVKRLDGVVRTVLEVGRDRGPVDEKTTCDVHATISAAVDVIMPKVRSRNVELDFRPMAANATVIGDPEALRGTWLNLIVNALDALEGQENGRIRISTHQDSEAELRVRIADNGGGVPPHAVDSIFEPFFTTKDHGNGIGLATALGTVKAAGGSISYDEEASLDGAVFVVRLRLAKSVPGDERAEMKQLKPASPIRGAA